ncbi:MAG: Probable GTPase related to EngC [uncultured Nocardioidaceae bacterium]|uniref:Small ribosomal subunit biogenesis GTPase RsgA n=1 Tax=uncultured Nocardioidaceae bacterium TaxID=253824 RepID=A0A6J4LUL1_9ACTN|nr:MAG: Probable GTPase related to EngC [uncultured Nocardioidaceae bacterium]
MRRSPPQPYIPVVLETIGYRPEMAAWAAHEDTRIGRVTRVDRGVAGVLTEGGPVRSGFGCGVLSEMARDPIDMPCTGDFVVVRDWPDHRLTIERVLPRRTSVVRATAGEQSRGQVLCANIDLAAVVIALHPLPTMAKLERLLALAWDSGAQPVVVLTKADMVGDAPLVAQDVAAAAPAVEVVCTSTRTGLGIARLRELLASRNTMAMLGSSGHGKSSLTNALVGAQVLATRDIRDDGRGRHTSVRRELVVLPGGGAVIDTPGLRGVGLIDAGAGLVDAFSDISSLAAACRFTDCAHGGEPDCAVTAAIADGSLPLRRLESWQKLMREQAWMTTRKDARLRAARNKARSRLREGGTTRG